MMKRFLAIFMAVVTVLPTANIPFAHAETTTGPWTWTDLSSQLTERTNRPIWAMAYANGSWFYTDGLNLWNGGQVYRYDGSTQINITNDVRNAGVERVDDIVSDGSSVLFLQDVVRQDNQLKIVSYRNGQYLNITTTVRNALFSDEGVSSLNGRSGTWYIVTTKARLFRWDGTSSSPVQITLPSGLLNAVDSTSASLVYNVNHGSPSNGSGRLPLSIVPITNNQWMLAGDPSNGTVRFYRYDGSTFTDVTSNVLPNADYISKIATNGTSVLISGYANGIRNRLTNGTNSYDIYGKGNLSDASVSWNGKSWMLVQGKNLSRLSGSFSNQTTEDYGRTADRLLTMASDNNGRLLVGGALSTTNMDEPSHPLTAKLVMVTEGVSAPNTSNNSGFGGDHVYTSANGPRMTTQGDPSNFRVGNGKDFNYRVSATDTDGVDRIELYVNDTRIKTCYAETCEFLTTYFTNGQASRSVKFWARSTDKRGYATDNTLSPDYLTVDVNASTSAGNSGSQTSDSVSGINSWTWLDPNTTTLNKDQNVTFNVGAQDTNGLKKIEIYVNGSVVRTCDFSNATGNQTCMSTVYANNYTQGTSVFVNAKLTDASNNTAWTSGTTLYRSNDNSSSNNGSNTNSNGSIWTSLDPNTTTLNNNQSTIFNVGAQDSDGLRRVEIMANGSVIRTCDFSDVSGNQACNVTIYGSNYTQGTNVYVNAKATDRYGNTVWSNSTTLTRSNDNGSSNNTGTGTISAWSWFEPTGDLKRNATTQLRSGAWADRGLNSIELFVNGSSKRFCSFSGVYGNQTCDVTLNGNDYTVGTSVSANAKVTDKEGKVVWTNVQHMNVIAADTGSNNGNTGSDLAPSVWEWVEPNTDHVAVNGNLTYGVGAWDENSVRSITIWVNGVARPACNFSNAGNQQCTITVSGSNYVAGSNVFVNAVAKDANGRETWTSGKTIRIDGGTNSGNNNGSVTISSDHESVFRSGDMISFWTTGSDADGVNRVEITVNGIKTKTCNGTGTCSVNLGPFSTRAVVTYSATLFDNKGNTVSSGSKKIYLSQ